MIGYDIGARFELNDEAAGPFGYANSDHSNHFENLLPADTLMDRMPEIGPLHISGGVAEHDADMNAASELLAVIPRGLGTGGLPEGEVPSDIGRDGMGAPVGDAIAALFHPNRGGLLADMPSGEQASASIGMPIQKSDFESDTRLSGRDGEVPEVGSSQRRFFVPDVPGLAKGQADTEYAYPHLPKTFESATESDPILDAMEPFDHRGDRETFYDAPATNNASGRSRESGVFEPAGVAGDDATESDNGESQGADMLDEAPYDRIIQAFGDLFPDRPAGGDAATAEDEADFGVAIAGLNARFDRLSGERSARTDGVAPAQQGDTWHMAGVDLPDEPEGEIGEALRLQPDSRNFLSTNETSDAAGITGIAGMWEMMRNAERFLPKQGIVARQSAEVATRGLSDAAAPRPKGLPGEWLARGNVNEVDPEALNMPASRGNSGGERSGPSGHKNDPIYMVAVNQVNGTLMPTVPTAGTGTRSPAMPGQRNLP
jgi:hypothetical protein